MLVVMQVIKMQPLTPGPILFAVFSAGAAIFLSLWVGAIIRQSQERHRLIEELETTRVELAVAERLAGKLEERQRLAREIHDTLAQGFVSIVTLLEATDAKLADGEGTAARWWVRPLIPPGITWQRPAASCGPCSPKHSTGAH